LPLVAALAASIVLGARTLARDGPDGLEGLLVDVPVHEKVLDNGLRVLVSPRKGAPRVACAFWFRVGSVDEKPGRTGLAHILEHMMFKGTKRIGVRDPSLDQALERGLDETWRARKELEPRIGEAKLQELRARDRTATELARDVLWKVGEA